MLNIMSLQKNFRVLVCILIVLLLGLIGWKCLRSSHPLQSEPDETITSEMTTQTVAGTGPMTNTSVTYYIPAIWTYKNALEGDELPLKNVSKIPAGLLVDANSGRILWAKHSREPQKIASMTKMMTVLLAMEAVKKGVIMEDTSICVSAAASRIGGSQVYLKEGEVFTLEELLKSIMIVSANDSAHLVAEAIAGDVDTFVSMMNERAKELGMHETVFYNVHGLPLKGRHNSSSALDMAKLARELLKYPGVLQWTSTWMDTFRNGEFKMVNHNSLVNPVSGVKGVDGLKTGYYSQAGFCVTATALRGTHRLIAVVIGIENKSVRSTFVKELIEWGYLQNPI